MNRVIFIYFIPFLLFSQVLEWEDRDIAIIQWKKTASRNEIGKNIAMGLLIKIDEYNLKGKADKIDGTFRKVARKKYRLVVVIGDVLTSATKRYLSETPVVFSGTQANLDEIHKKFPTITGVYSFASPEIQFNTINLLVNDIKKIGVIFNPKYSTDQVKMFESVISDTSIKIMKNGISNPKEVETALHFMEDVDLLWLPEDPIFRDNKAMESILNYSFKKRTPVFASSEEFVKKGALAALTPRNISLETLSILTSITKGKDISSIEPRFSPTELSVNQTTAIRLGISIPEELIFTAKKIYK